MIPNDEIKIDDHRKSANVSIADLIQWINKLDETDGPSDVKAQMTKIVKSQGDRAA